METFLNQIIEVCTNAGSKLLLAIIVFLIGKMLIGKVMTILERNHLHFTYTYSEPNNLFRSVAQACPTVCDPMDCSTPGLLVYHQLPEQIGRAHV